MLVFRTGLSVPVNYTHWDSAVCVCVCVLLLWTIIIVLRGMCGMCLMINVSQTVVSGHRAGLMTSWSSGWIQTLTQEIQAASSVRVIFWITGAWRGVPQFCCMNCGARSDWWHLYFTLFQNYVNVLAATTVRSQLCDQHQYLVGILLCLSYSIVIVGQIHGRRYSVHHNSAETCLYLSVWP